MEKGGREGGEQGSSMNAFARTCFAGNEHALDCDCNAVLLFNVRSELPVRRPVARLLRQIVDFDLVVEVRALFNFSSPRFGRGGSSTPGDCRRAILRGIESSGDVRSKS